MPPAASDSGPPARLTTALGRSYRIERELGQGGMATVYLAHDLKHDRDVAIKVLHPELGAALGAERFLSEIKTTARLQHPHILPLLDSGAADGLLYYVMPLVTGETLRQRLEREKQLPVDVALLIAREVADALGYAHGLGIVHRDIKPENILLQGGHALVADFGIALAVQQAGGQRMTQTGLSLGTPQYMSPEQAMGEKSVDARSDLYALGAVTYEMLTGEPPFTGATVQAIVAKVMTEKPAPISTTRDTVPAGMEQAVLRALAKLPADRFSSADAFAAALVQQTSAVTASGRGAPARGLAARLAPVLGVMTIASLALAAWALAGRGKPASTVTTYDAMLPDSAAMSVASDLNAAGFGNTGRYLSVAPAGTFVVYPAAQGESTILWRRSLLDATAQIIPGTVGGTVPRISPDGTQIAFYAGGRLKVVSINGGDARTLLEMGSAPVSLEWISTTRLMTIANDGFRLQWLDADLGVIDNAEFASGRITRCVFAFWIAEDKTLLCNFNEFAQVLDPKTGEVYPVTARTADGRAGVPLSGSAFRLIDGAWMVYVSLIGELRAAPYDRATHSIGRPVTLLNGIRRDVLGSAQVDFAASGALVYAPSTTAFQTQMVDLRPGTAPVPLPIERATFLRFDLSRNRRWLAAVVGVTDGQELRIYDLQTGQRQVWLQGTNIREPIWAPNGDRILVRVEAGPRSAVILGSPFSSAAPDTLVAATLPDRAPSPGDYPSDSVVLLRGYDKSTIVRLDPRARPVRTEQLLTDGFFAVVSPGGQHLSWHTSDARQLLVSAFPPDARRVQVATGGVEPMWLGPNELLYRKATAWWLARLNPETHELLAAPTLWGSDPQFLDTPGWSNRFNWDGGFIYARNPEPASARYLRVVPDFVTTMKAAVKEANR